MVKGKHKSKTMRKVFVRTPGAKTVIQRGLRRHKEAVCTVCGDSLKGVSRARTNVYKKLAVTHKRPTRPYGGNLCSKCSKNKIKLKARV